MRPPNLQSKFALLISLLVVVKLNKNADPDKCSYSGYGIEFDTHGIFWLLDVSGFGKNEIIFGVDNSSSAHADNKKYIP